MLEKRHLHDGLFRRSQWFLHSRVISARNYANRRPNAIKPCRQLAILSVDRFHYFDSALINRRSNILATFSLGSSTRSNLICNKNATDSIPAVNSLYSTFFFFFRNYSKKKTTERQEQKFANLQICKFYFFGVDFVVLWTTGMTISSLDGNASGFASGFTCS